MQINCCGNQDEGVSAKLIINSSCTEHKIAEYSNFESPEAVYGDTLSCAFPGLKIEFPNEVSGLSKSENGCCAPDALEIPSSVESAELLENQKVFTDGFLGTGFMVRSSGLSKDVRWDEFLCPGCSCLVGAYPCFQDDVPLDGGVRLFKCYISTPMPSNQSNDAFSFFIGGNLIKRVSFEQKSTCNVLHQLSHNGWVPCSVWHMDARAPGKTEARENSHGRGDGEFEESTRGNRNRKRKKHERDRLKRVGEEYRVSMLRLKQDSPASRYLKSKKLRSGF